MSVLSVTVRGVSADKRNDTVCATVGSGLVSLMRNEPDVLLQRANSSSRDASYATGPWKPSSNCSRPSSRLPSMRTADTHTPTRRSSPPPIALVSDTEMSIPV